MDILISENISGTSIDNLRKYYDVQLEKDLWKDSGLLAERAKHAKALIVRNQTKVDKNILNSANELKVIGRAGVGYDNIDVDYASKKGIVVCYTPDGNTISTAELAIALILSLLRKIPSAVKSTKEGNWDRYNHTGNEIYGKTLGIVGYGKIGRALAERARVFGTKILAYDIYIPRDDANIKNNVVKPVQLNELLSQSDIVSLHLPSTNETKNLFNKKLFGMMKKGSILINNSRGNLVVENDLVDAIKSGQLKGAALDVRTTEPPVISELEKFDNVLLTPHIGGLTEESQERVLNTLTKDISSVLNGKSAENYVNFPLPK